MFVVQQIICSGFADKTSQKESLGSLILTLLFSFFFWQAIMSEAFVYMEQVTSSGFLTPPLCLQISLSLKHIP